MFGWYLFGAPPSYRTSVSVALRRPPFSTQKTSPSHQNRGVPGGTWSSTKGSWPAQPRSSGPDFNDGGKGQFFEELAYLAGNSPETNSFKAPPENESFQEESLVNYTMNFQVRTVSFYLCKLCKHIINMRNIWQLDIIQRDLDHGCIKTDLYTFVCCYIMELKSLKSNWIKLVQVNLQPGRENTY